MDGWVDGMDRHTCWTDSNKPHSPMPMEQPEDGWTHQSHHGLHREETAPTKELQSCEDEQVPQRGKWTRVTWPSEWPWRPGAPAMSPPAHSSATHPRLLCEPQQLVLGHIVDAQKIWLNVFTDHQTLPHPSSPKALRRAHEAFPPFY